MKNLIPDLTVYGNMPDGKENLIRLSGEVSEYIPTLSDMLSSADNTLSGKILYSTDSTMYRGYFCPNPYQEKIVGNVKRGKLSEKKKTGKHVHEYIFNFNNELIKVNEYKNGEILSEEKITRQDNIEHSLLWSCGLLSVFTECVYDNEKRIKQFSRCMVHPYSREVTEIEQHVFGYHDDEHTEIVHSTICFLGEDVIICKPLVYKI